MKDKIYQQIGFAKSRLDQAEEAGNDIAVLEWKAYIQGLRYCLGLVGASESDKHVNMGEL